MNKSLITEDEQRSLFINHFKNSSTNLYCEVPVFCRSVDLVKYNSCNHTISAIEFKLTDWKRVINQVLNVSISFDFLEICISEPKTAKSKNLIIKKCEDLGLGLYFFNHENVSFVYSVLPKKVEKSWGIQKEQILKYIEGVKIDG